MSLFKKQVTMPLTSPLPASDQKQPTEDEPASGSPSMLATSAGPVPTAPSDPVLVSVRVPPVVPIWKPRSGHPYPKFSKPGTDQSLLLNAMFNIFNRAMIPSGTLTAPMGQMAYCLGGFLESCHLVLLNPSCPFLKCFSHLQIQLQQHRH